jgi:hypothetical protein
MLIVCNGAAKSGSTWLYNIVKHLVSAEWPPATYLTSSRKHPTIKPDLLERYLDEQDFRSRDVITKTHYGSPRLRELLLARPDVRVIDMDRNLCDVIVSTYYDSRLREGFAGDFRRFYWFEGRRQAEYLIRYHRLWGDGHPQVCVTSFEALKTAFADEVAKVAAFLGVGASAERIAEIRKETDIGALRDKYKDDPFYSDPKNPFFRKGEIGDWRNHFDEAMLADIRRIEQQGLRRFDRIEIANRLRREVYKRFPSLSPYRNAQA